MMKGKDVFFKDKNYVSNSVAQILELGRAAPTTTRENARAGNHEDLYDALVR